MNLKPLVRSELKDSLIFQLIASRPICSIDLFFSSNPFSDILIQKGDY